MTSPSHGIVLFWTLISVVSVSGLTWRAYRGYEYSVSDYSDADDKHSFDDARSICMADGGDLAIIRDNATLAWLENTVLPSGCTANEYIFWVGLSKQSGPSGEGDRLGWTWLDGSSLGTVGEWASHEPSEGDEHVRLYCSSDGYQWRASVEENEYRYLCSRVATDECASSPCVHGACVNQVKRFTCNCAGTGYIGTICEIEIDECESNPCVNNGTCENNINMFICNCVAGYTGTMCDTDIDECASDPCDNNGTCVDDINMFSCNCSAGYNGTNCETDIDECVSSPCDNNGTCVDEVNMFTCDCGEGYTGTVCETDIDDCADNVECIEGVCVDAVNNFTCNCHEGFTGHYCGIDIATGLTTAELAAAAAASSGGSTIIVVIIFFWWRRKKKKTTEKDNDVNLDDIGEYNRATIYDEPDEPDTEYSCIPDDMDTEYSCIPDKDTQYSCISDTDCNPVDPVDPPAAHATAVGNEYTDLPQTGTNIRPAQNIPGDQQGVFVLPPLPPDREKYS